MISRRFNIKLNLMLLSSGSEKLSITCQLFKDLNIQWICVNKTNHAIRWIAIYLVNSIIPIALSTFRTTQARSLSQSVTGIKYLIIAQDKKNLPVFKSLEEIPLVDTTGMFEVSESKLSNFLGTQQLKFLTRMHVIRSYTLN